MRHSRHTPSLALALALLLGGAGAALAQDYTVGPLQISHPWSPATPEGAKSAPGYLTVTNTGREPDRIISGSFIDAGHVVIPPVVINPGTTVTLRPGGEHLTFTGLVGALEKGSTAQSILRFEKAGPVVLEFAIEGASAKGAHAGKSGHSHVH